MNDRAVMLALRLVHVVAGLLWVGAAVMLVAFVLPAARNSGAGIRYLRQLIWVQRLPLFLNTVLVLTLASGLALYGNLSMLTRGAWVRTPAGITFGLGALAAIVAAAIATFVAAPAVHRAIELGDRVQAAGTNPVLEDLTEMGRAQTRYAMTMRLVAGLLLATAAAMAVARYLN